MTPIDQVNPAQPGNWTRRIEPRNKRDERRRPAGPDDAARRHGNDKPGETPDQREHIIDELA